LSDVGVLVERLPILLRISKTPGLKVVVPETSILKRKKPTAQSRRKQYRGT
jgi:hypothetical protein